MKGRLLSLPPRLGLTQHKQDGSATTLPQRAGGAGVGCEVWGVGFVV